MLLLLVHHGRLTMRFGSGLLLRLLLFAKDEEDSKADECDDGDAADDASDDGTDGGRGLVVVIVVDPAIIVIVRRGGYRGRGDRTTGGACDDSGAGWPDGTAGCGVVCQGERCPVARRPAGVSGRRGLRGRDICRIAPVVKDAVCKGDGVAVWSSSVGTEHDISLLEHLGRLEKGPSSRSHIPFQSKAINKTATIAETRRRDLFRIIACPPGTTITGVTTCNSARGISVHRCEEDAAGGGPACVCRAGTPRDVATSVIWRNENCGCG